MMQEIPLEESSAAFVSDETALEVVNRALWSTTAAVPDSNEQEPGDFAPATGAVSEPPVEVPTPTPLPTGWIMKRATSVPPDPYTGEWTYYYYHLETGETTWDPYFLQPDESQFPSQAEQDALKEAVAAVIGLNTTEGENDKRSWSPVDPTDASPPMKKSRVDERRSSVGSNTSNNGSGKSHQPTEVRVLHILKKHKDSRRPSSWRSPKITLRRDEAAAELQSLREILEEVQDSPDELRATFEELARTESDCSSAKAGGDLGFFGRKKMQPAFENAAFALQINELSQLVDTKSGVHLLLRVG
jgi:peptidyl-prolyl cis-trans isomerase NIMA-interacting 1